MLKVRVLTAVVALGVLLVVLFVLPPAIAQGVFAALILAGLAGGLGCFPFDNRTYL